MRVVYFFAVNSSDRSTQSICRAKMERRREGGYMEFKVNIANLVAVRAEKPPL